MAAQYFARPDSLGQELRTTVESVIAEESALLRAARFLERRGGTSFDEALVGARAAAEVPELVPELEAVGMRDVHTRAVGVGLGAAATTVVVMTRGAR